MCIGTETYKTSQRSSESAVFDKRDISATNLASEISKCWNATVQTLQESRVVCRVYSRACFCARGNVRALSFVASYTGIAGTETQDTLRPPSAVGSFKFGHGGPKLGEEDMFGAI